MLKIGDLAQGEFSPRPEPAPEIKRCLVRVFAVHKIQSEKNRAGIRQISQMRTQAKRLTV